MEAIRDANITIKLMVTFTHDKTTSNSLENSKRDSKDFSFSSTEPLNDSEDRKVLDDSQDLTFENLHDDVSFFKTIWKEEARRSVEIWNRLS